MDLKQELLKIKINELEASIGERSWFNVTPVREIAELKGINTSDDPSLELLHSYHCVDWESMSIEVKDELLRVVNEYLNPPVK
jgi:hypothetical protein